MTDPAAEHLADHRRAPAVSPDSLLFAGAAFAFLWVRVNPSLLYHAYWLKVRHPVTFPVFRTGGAFLRQFLDYPGGPVEYAGAFACQLYYHAWAGAALAAALAWLLAVTTRHWIRAALGVRTRLLHYAPAVVLLTMYARYLEPIHMGLAVAVALVAAVGYGSLNLRTTRARIATFACMAAAVYYLAGGACLLFAALCGLSHAGNRRWAAAGSCVVLGAALPFAADVLQVLRPLDAYARLLPFHRCANPRALRLGLCLYLAAPAALTGAWLWGHLSRRIGPRVGSRFAGLRSRIAPLGGTRAGRALAVLAPVLLAMAVALAAVDGPRRTRFLVEYYSRRGMWDDVLRAARALPVDRYSLPLSWDVNRALCATGRLGSDMLAYPQTLDGLLPRPSDFPDANVGQQHLMKLSEALLATGRVNEAELAAYEALESVDDQPHVLRHLALIAVAKGQMPAGRVLLGALSRDLIHGRWARRQIALLEETPELAMQPDAGRLRRMMVGEGGTGWQWMDTERMLLDLVEANPDNRTALDYLAAYYLLSRQTAKVAEVADRMETAGYQAMPPLVQEAMLIDGAAQGARKGPRDARITPETLDRFRRFHTLAGEQRSGAAGAADRLGPEFGSSYFFYHYAEPAGN